MSDANLYIPPPDKLVRGPDVVAMLKRQQAALEGMFDDENLASLRAERPLHPAVTSFDAQAQLIREKQRLVPSLHQEDILEAARQMLDQYTWVPDDLSPDFWSFLPDARTRARTVGALRNETQYDDTLAELFCWGWLRIQGYPAERVEDDALADIAINRGSPDEVRVEVKRIHRGTSIERIAKVIKKANKQIKQSRPGGGGALFISLDLPLEHALPADEVPLAVETYQQAAFAATRTHNSSVGQIVITWEDFIAKGEAPGPVSYFVRRRSLTIEHGAPLRAPALPTSRLAVGQTSLISLTFEKGKGLNQSKNDLLRQLVEVSSDDLGAIELSMHTQFEISPHLKDHDDLSALLRPNHVRQALANADGAVVHDLGELSQLVVTKRITTKGGAFLLVVIAISALSKLTIIGGYRVYDEPASLARLAQDPNEAFAVVLERYGTRFHADEHTFWWVPEFTVSIEQAEPLTQQDVMDHVGSAAGVEWGYGASTLTSLVQVTRNREIHVAGMFWINIDRYRLATAAAQRTQAAVGRPALEPGTKGL